MDQRIQSALEIANQGDKNKAAELLKQVLDSNPNDIDALLVLATLTEDGMRKRQILNRVLSLDTTNKTAREMSLEMDRAELRSYGASVDPTRSQSEPSKKRPDISLEKPLVFQFSKAWWIVLYFFLMLSCCIGISIATMKVSDSYPFIGMAIILAIGALTVSSKVEVSEEGIRVSAMTGKSEMKWDEIVSITPHPLRRNLELTSNVGESMLISTQIRGYRDIVDIIHLKRPDLYSQLVSISSQAVPSSITHSKPAAPAPAESVKPAVSTSTNPPVTLVNPASTPLPVPVSTVSQPEKTQEKKKEQKLVFTFPLFWRIFMYAFPILFGCLGLLIAVQNVLYGLPLIVLALVLGVIAVAFSPKVEVTETGIRSHGLLDTYEAQWTEIKGMKSNLMKRRLELTKENGEIVNVSTQVSRYPLIVEILRQKRPDLFTMTSQTASSGLVQGTPGITSREPAFTGTRTFQKGAFAQYGVSLLMVPLLLFGGWALMATEEKFVGISVILVALLFVVMSLFNVNHIKIELDKLSTESFFVQKEYTAKQIRDITMKTARSRQGTATNYVNIQLVEGGTIRLVGFSEGDEILYGVLKDWWETNKNKP